MSKIADDKYYTSPELARYCVNKVKEIIGADNITEYIEPSAGKGVFLDYLDKPYIAFDVATEDDRIVKADWLEEELEYKEGRCIIGNPPFGEKNLSAMKFYRKSIEIADYIAFILPISQWNNNQQMFQFDLMHSENLGVRNYSGRNIHCCFNIFKRPTALNKKPVKYEFKDVTFKEVRKARNQYLPKDFQYDIGICTWGSVGVEIKTIEDQGKYNQELYIRVNNLGLKDKILQIIRSADWNEIYPMTTMPRLKQWQVCRYLSQQIPELE